jgi:hypothetical protein
MRVLSTSYPDLEIKNLTVEHRHRDHAGKVTRAMCGISLALAVGELPVESISPAGF